jgi:hypothetical protein
MDTHLPFALSVSTILQGVHDANVAHDVHCQRVTGPKRFFCTGQSPAQGMAMLKV